MYTYEDVLEYIEQEDVRFIRLSFFDIFGVQKNISILPSEVRRAFKEGISVDGSAIAGFETEERSDLFLHPDPSTMSILPWRSLDGAVIRMFCDVRYPDETPYEADTRYMLKQAKKHANSLGFHVDFGCEVEFYLFQQDVSGGNTKIPFDNAGYMDVAPLDKGEDVRRDICLTLSDMGIIPEASHHEEGPGQNEIDFKYASSVRAADDAQTFKWVVKTTASANGLFADFSAKPLKNEAGNGMHINVSITSDDGEDYTSYFMAGVLDHIKEMTLFLNPTPESYERFGKSKAPKYISWSKQNRSQLIRVPATKQKSRFEIRSADPMANPYLAYALIMYAGIDGIQRKLQLTDAVDFNIYHAPVEALNSLEKLPSTIGEARTIAKDSEFIKKYIPEKIIKEYLK